MICIYCLQRPAAQWRRCEACHGYLVGLFDSDEQRDRDYGAQLIDLAAERSTRRLGQAGAPRAA